MGHRLHSNGRIETSAKHLKAYLRLFAAQIIALVGTGLSTVALTLLAYDLDGGNAGEVLGAALALKMVAYVAFAPLLATLAERLPSKAWLISLDVLRAGIVMVMPFAQAPWHVYVLIFVLNLCAAGFKPSFSAIIPELLPKEEHYARALSATRFAYDLENLLSPALAGLALIFFSYRGLFNANAVAFLVSALLILSASLPARPLRESSGGVWGNTLFGLRQYLSTPRLRGLLALYAGVAAASAMAIVNTVVYVKSNLGGNDRDVAVAMAAAGAGSMLAALAVPKLLRADGGSRSERGWSIVGGAVMTAAMVCFAMEPTFAGLCAAWFAAGIGWSLVQTPAGLVVKRSSRRAELPAYFAAHFSLTHLCWLLTYPAAGFLGAQYGMAVTGWVMACWVFGSLLLGWWLWPAKDVEPLETEMPA